MLKYKFIAQDEGLLATRCGYLEIAGEKIPTPFNIPTSTEEMALRPLRKNISGLSDLMFPQPIMEIRKFAPRKKNRKYDGNP